MHRELYYAPRIHVVLQFFKYFFRNYFSIKSVFFFQKQIVVFYLVFTKVTFSNSLNNIDVQKIHILLERGVLYNSIRFPTFSSFNTFRTNGNGIARPLFENMGVFREAKMAIKIIQNFKNNERKIIL